MLLVLHKPHILATEEEVRTFFLLAMGTLQSFRDNQQPHARRRCLTTNVSFLQVQARPWCAAHAQHVVSEGNAELLMQSLHKVCLWPVRRGIAAEAAAEV